MDVQALLEAELRQRGIAFDIDKATGQYAIGVNGARALISVENLQRDVARGHDAGRVTRFVDAIVTSIEAQNAPLHTDQLYWCLEPNDYAEPAEIRVPVSECVDRVLVRLSPDGELITWVTQGMLARLGVSLADAGDLAFRNLDAALREASIEFQHIEPVKLGFVATRLPFKASLILASSLREVVQEVLGWPLMAVAPDRDFLYLWSAEYADFAQRVGGVVVDEYTQASYPISTEIFELSDGGIRAIGAFAAKR